VGSVPAVLTLSAGVLATRHRPDVDELRDPGDGDVAEGRDAAGEAPVNALDSAFGTSRFM
jgi:hypothetical protein